MKSACSRLAGCMLALGLAASAHATDIAFTAGEYSSHTRPLLEKMARDYEALHPDIHIHVQVLPWDSYLQALTTDVSGSRAPDMSIIATIWLSDFASQGIVEPLDGYVSPAFKAAFIPNFLTPSTIGGKLLGLPAAASARAMMVNLDLLKKAGVSPPKTWDELETDAKKVAQIPGVYGFGLQGKEVETDTYYYYALWSFGGDILTPSGQSGLGSPDAIAAAAYYKRLIDEKATEPEPTGYSREDVFNMFKQGRVGIIFTFPMLIPQIKSEAPNLHYAVLPFPVGKQQATLGVTDVLVVYKSSPVKKQVLDFIQFMFQDKYRSEFDREEGLLPVTRNVVAEDYYRTNPDMSAFAAGLPYAKFAPTIPHWADMADVTTRALQAIYLGQSTPSAAMTGAAAQIDQLLSEH